MTKMQSWILIVAVLLLVGMVAAYLNNQHKVALSRASSCFNSCQATYFNSNGTESMTDQQNCETACYTNNGLQSPDFYLSPQ